MWMHRAAGWLWAGAWSVILFTVHAPWSELGGLVSERLRWTEWFVLSTALLVGQCVGSYARHAARAGTGRSHAGLLRWLLLPQAAAVAAALVVLRLYGPDEVIGVVATGFLAYWAGLDLAFAAWPLMTGRSYRFRAGIDPDPVIETGDQVEEDAGWTPPWERF